MNFERKISLSIDEGVVAELTVSFTENEEGPDEFRAVVRRSPYGNVEGEAVWHVHEQDGSFSLQITTQFVASGICLAGCFAGIVTSTGPLVDCLKKAKSRRAVRDCISQHGVWQAVGALSCIYGCLSL